MILKFPKQLNLRKNYVNYSIKQRLKNPGKVVRKKNFICHFVKWINKKKKKKTKIKWKKKKKKRKKKFKS